LKDGNKEKKKKKRKDSKKKRKDKNELDSPKGDASLLNQSSLSVPVPNLPTAQSSPHLQLQQLQQQQQQQLK